MANVKGHDEALVLREVRHRLAIFAEDWLPKSIENCLKSRPTHIIHNACSPEFIRGPTILYKNDWASTESPVAVCVSIDA